MKGRTSNCMKRDQHPLGEFAEYSTDCLALCCGCHGEDSRSARKMGSGEFAGFFFFLLILTCCKVIFCVCLFFLDSYPVSSFCFGKCWGFIIPVPLDLLKQNKTQWKSHAWDEAGLGGPHWILSPAGPSILGTRVWICRRQFFHWPGWGVEGNSGGWLRNASSMLHLLCTLFLLFLHQLHLRSSGSISWRLGTPVLYVVCVARGADVSTPF